VVDLKRMRSHPDNKTKQAMQRDCEEAADAIEALYKDAERYRWMRDRCPWTMCSAHAVTRLALRMPIDYQCHTEDKNDMDAAIDASMAKETP
jgi:hypothetical protein